YDLKPLGLFHETVNPTVARRHWGRHAASYAPILLVFWALAIWQSQSLFFGTVFIAGFLVAISIMGAIAWLVLRLCGLNANSKVVTRKLALRNLDRNRLGALSCFLAIGLGSLLINLIPQIQKGLQEEISQPVGVSMPDFFMFDIQPDQLAGLEATLAERGYSLTFLSPMIRARLEAVNDLVIDETEETPDEQLLQRRQYNLTYQL